MFSHPNHNIRSKRNGYTIIGGNSLFTMKQTISIILIFIKAFSAYLDPCSTIANFFRGNWWHLISRPEPFARGIHPTRVETDERNANLAYASGLRNLLYGRASRHFNAYMLELIKDYR